MSERHWIRDLVVDALAIAFFFGLVVLGALPATTASGFVVAVVAGRLSVEALVAKFTGGAPPVAGVPLPPVDGSQLAAAAATAGGGAAAPTEASKHPPSSGLVVIGLGLWHLLERLLSSGRA